MELLHVYNTDKPFPCADEYYTFAFFGWLLLQHDNGSMIEIEASYANDNEIRIKEVVNGSFSGNYDDYTVIGYCIKPEYLRENRPKFTRV